MQTRSSKLPLDHKIQRRNTNGDNYLPEVDVQLRLLDSSHSTSGRKFRNLEANRFGRSSPLAQILSDALNLYEDFPEPHLNSFQHEILDELIDYLDLKFE